MSLTIAVRYENGVFSPLEKVTLPEHTVIRLVIPDMPPRKSRRQLKGILSGMDIQVNEQDIRNLRSEMWKSFPRDIS
jgi:predicted DNA-binding antitoxin AbrB/MazE fold protein